MVETNSRRASFDDIRARPVSFRVNLLRSASGRAYLAFCPDREREAVLRRLRERDLPGHELAARPEALHRIVQATRRQGYAVRAADFGGYPAVLVRLDRIAGPEVEELLVEARLTRSGWRAGCWVAST